MKFSSELVEQCKQKLGFQRDAELLEVIPKMTKGLLSSVKSGNRELTNEQGLAIANLCNINPEWVVVNLAAEVAERKNEEALRSVWAGLAKKLSKAVCVVMMSGIYFMGAGPDLGKHAFLRRSRLFV